MHEELHRLKEDAKRNKASMFGMLFRPKLAIIVWFRLCNVLKDSRLKLLYFPSKLMLHLYRQITGIQIDPGTPMGGVFILNTILALQLQREQ